jgi:putative membrane protein
MKRWLWGVWSFGGALILFSAASSAGAQEVERGGAWRPDSFLMAIVSTLVFGLIGILVAIVGFKLYDIFTPFDVEREICEKQNMAVALLSGAMVLGICLIVAAAVL